MNFCDNCNDDLWKCTGQTEHSVCIHYTVMCVHVYVRFATILLLLMSVTVIITIIITRLVKSSLHGWIKYFDFYAIYPRCWYYLQMCFMFLFIVIYGIHKNLSIISISRFETQSVMCSNLIFHCPIVSWPYPLCSDIPFHHINI